MCRNTDFLGALEDVIDARLAEASARSYTARLAAGGLQDVAQKVGEEAVETVLAAVANDDRALLDESADLVFHLLLLLRLRGLSLADVSATLQSRHESAGGGP